MVVFGGIGVVMVLRHCRLGEWSWSFVARGLRRMADLSLVNYPSLRVLVLSMKVVRFTACGFYDIFIYICFFGLIAWPLCRFVCGNGVHQLQDRCIIVYRLWWSDIDVI